MPGHCYVSHAPRTLALMRRHLIPLILASDAVMSEDEREPLDRLRMQKGVFLLTKRGSVDWQNTYEFSPYDWGPFSRELVFDLERLVDEGFLEKERVPGHRYRRYRTTDRGDELLAREGLTAPEKKFVERTRSFVTSRSFSELLRDVYAEYPDYAVNSRFRG